MKIVFVNRYYAPDQSATSRMLTDLATALAADHSVHVVTSRSSIDDSVQSLAARETIDGVRIHRVWSTRFGRESLFGRACDYACFYVGAFLQLLRIVRRGDIVVAKTDPPLVSVLAGWAARMRRAKLINWLQDVFPEVAGALGLRVAQGVLGRALSALRNRSLRSAAVNVVVGVGMRSRVASLGVDSERIALIPNWADGAALQPLHRESNPLRSAWGLGDAFVVGYSGNLGRVHEFETVLGAARELQMRSDVTFLLIGDGAQKAEVVAAIRAQRLVNVVMRPLQPRELLSQSLCVADVHVVTLRPELEGLVVPSKFYGIAAVGRPTLAIGNRDGEIACIVREMKMGLAVRQGDVAGLVSAITTLRDERVVCEQMGANARRVFLERFDRPIAIAAWRSVLQRVAATSDSAAQRRR